MGVWWTGHGRPEAGFGSGPFVVRVCASSRGLLHPSQFQTTLDVYERERSPRRWFTGLCILSLSETHSPPFPGPPISEPWIQGHSLCYAPLSLPLTLDSHLLYPVTRGLGTHISFWFTVFLLPAKLVDVERGLLTLFILAGLSLRPRMLLASGPAPSSSSMSSLLRQQVCKTGQLQSSRPAHSFSSGNTFVNLPAPG